MGDYIIALLIIYSIHLYYGIYKEIRLSRLVQPTITEEELMEVIPTESTDEDLEYDCRLDESYRIVESELYTITPKGDLCVFFEGKIMRKSCDTLYKMRLNNEIHIFGWKNCNTGWVKI